MVKTDSEPCDGKHTEVIVAVELMHVYCLEAEKIRISNYITRAGF